MSYILGGYGSCTFSFIIPNNPITVMDFDYNIKAPVVSEQVIGQQFTDDNGVIHESANRKYRYHFEVELFEKTAGDLVRFQVLKNRCTSFRFSPFGTTAVKQYFDCVDEGTISSNYTPYVIELPQLGQSMNVRFMTKNVYPVKYESYRDSVTGYGGGGVPIVTEDDESIAKGSGDKLEGAVLMSDDLYLSLGDELPLSYIDDKLSLPILSKTKDEYPVDTIVVIHGTTDGTTTIVTTDGSTPSKPTF